MGKQVPHLQKARFAVRVFSKKSAFFSVSVGREVFMKGEDGVRGAVAGKAEAGVDNLFSFSQIYARATT
jgi:hypothetical protein